ncbi:MAG: dienelactone hydrolase family protein [Thermoanaerobaculia bacterium]|nr:dienelactone hydrolase family protein [Thermoanaerobaculia bacterium]
MISSLEGTARLSVLALLPLLMACGPQGTEEAGEVAAPTPEEQQHVDAMAREHADETPQPSPAVEGGPHEPIVTREVEYAEIDGRTVRGYLARPEGGEAPPGVVVIHEWWGLNDNIRRMADKLAGRGYAALAVDLYQGQAASEPDRARELMQEATGRQETLKQNLRTAHDYLVNEVGTPRTGVIGWCFGGGWALRTGFMIPELDATVVYYGRVVTDEERLRNLSSPLLGHFGAEDQGIPVNSVRELEATLEELDKAATIHVYEGAGHAFANPSGSRYREEAAETAWDRTLDFFQEHLERSSGDSEESG